MIPNVDAGVSSRITFHEKALQICAMLNDLLPWNISFQKFATPVFLLNIFSLIILVMYIENRIHSSDPAIGYDLDEAFSKSTLVATLATNSPSSYSILAGCVVSISMGVVILIDLALSTYLKIPLQGTLGDFNILQTQYRIFLSLILLSSVFIIIAHARNQAIVTTFCLVHAVQLVAANSVVMRMLNNSYPTIFTDLKCKIVVMAFHVGSTTSFIGFGQAPSYWSNLITFSTFLVSGVIFGSALISLFKQHDLISRSSERNFLNDNTVVYLFFYAVASMLIFVCSTRHLNAWLELDIVDANIYVYSLILFAYGVNIVPTMMLRRLLIESALSSAKTESKSTIIRYLSHEIRTPLMIILTNLELIMEEIGDLPPAFVDLIKKITARLNDAIHSSKATMMVLNDSLFYESVDAGKFSLAQEQVPAVEMLRGMVDRCLSFGFEKKLRIKFENRLTDASHQVYGLFDAPKMEQVIRNLLTNAVKFTPEGGSITVSVAWSTSLSPIPETSAATEKDSNVVSANPGSVLQRIMKFSNAGFCLVASNKVLADPDIVEPAKSLPRFEKYMPIELRVKDSGCGIDQSDLSRVFGQFQQFNANKLQGGGGSGLGLWICRQITVAHGGTIAVSSEGIGKGTSMVLVFDSYKEISNTPSAEQQPYSVMRSMKSRSGSASQKHGNSNSNSNEGTYERIDQFVSNSPTRKLQRGAGNGEEYSFSAAIDVFSAPLRAESLSSAQPWIQAVDGSTDGDHNQPLLQELEERKQSQLLRILVVDDSLMCRKVLMDMIRRIFKTDLAGSQFVLSDATDGVKAVNAVQKSIEDKLLFDIIFMDNTMPNLNGPDATRMIRKLGYTSRILGVTGNVHSRDVDEFMDAGADQIFDKPMERKTILAILKESMQSS